MTRVTVGYIWSPVVKPRVAAFMDTVRCLQ